MKRNSFFDNFKKWIWSSIDYMSFFKFLNIFVYKYLNM